MENSLPSNAKKCDKFPREKIHRAVAVRKISGKFDAEPEDAILVETLPYKYDSVPGCN